MSQYYGRPLNNQELVRNFLSNTLDFDYKKFKNLIPDIVASEAGIAAIANEPPTLTSQANRTFTYKDDSSRWELRKKIIDELLSKKRLLKDDKMKLGTGGALPLTPVQNKKQAFILIGPPASGKSGASEKIADDYGAIIIDSDYAKRKLPEFREFPYGASLVHDESSAITHSFKNVHNPNDIKSLFEICLDKSYNIIIPKIGNSYESILTLSESLKSINGYKVHLILVALSKRKATIRAALRFYTTKRYVPLSLIFDEYGNDSWLTYFYLRCKHQNVFKSFGAISTDVDKGTESVGFDIKGPSPVSTLNFKDIKIIW